MRNTVIQRLNSVIYALNHVEVKEKTNMANMVGAINVLEELTATLSKVDFATPEKQKDEPQD